MHSFESDYTAGARVEILRRLNETNLEQLPGYGSDKYCESAKEKIRAACDCPGADIFFMVGGTQTNAVVIDSMLPSYGGVIAAQTGHISDHEAGAIEFTGHKVIALPVYDGKLRAEDVWMYMKDYWQDASHQHFVYPGMVYISYPTEFGTLYTKRELVELASVCRWYNIPLYIDGARLGYGLMSPKCDITLPELAQLCDVFYIGGTKVGALFGEAAVFTKHNMPRYFSTIANSTARCWPRAACSACSSTRCLRTTCISASASTPSTWPCRSAMPSMRVACSSIFIRRRTCSSSSWRTRPSVPCSRRLPSTPGARSTRSTALPASPRAGPQRRRMSTR